jgi:hypothetical protein
MTLAELILAVKEYADRPTLSDDLVSTFIKAIEPTITRALHNHSRLRVRRNWPQPAAKATLPLPTDLLHLVKVRIAKVALIQYSPGQEEEATNGYIYRGDCLELYPAPAIDTVYTLDYQAALPSLFNVTDQTNWVLEYHSDIYLFGTLEQLAAYTRDLDAKKVWQIEFRSRLEELAIQGWDEVFSIGGK